MEAHVLYIFAFLSLYATLNLIMMLWPDDFSIVRENLTVWARRSSGKSEEAIEAELRNSRQGFGFLALLMVFPVILLMVSAGAIKPLLCLSVWLPILTILGILKFVTENPDAKVVRKTENLINTIARFGERFDLPPIVYEDRGNWKTYVLFGGFAILPILAALGYTTYQAIKGNFICLCGLAGLVAFFLLSAFAVRLSD